MSNDDLLAAPRNVVLAFASEHTRWERDMTATDATGGNAFSDQTLQTRRADLLLKYCTHKQGAYVDGIASFSEPPTYSKVTSDQIAEIGSATRSRTYFDTCHLGSHAYRFVLIKKRERWRIDSVKWRFHDDAEWENTLPYS